MDSKQLQKAKSFYDMHVNEGCFLMPNAWDIGSAKMLVAAGFKSIATTSAGVAFSLGCPDNGFCSVDARLNRDKMLTQVNAIAESVSVPVNADLEDGFGRTPEQVAKTIELAIAAGAVGGNIEDYTGDKNHPLYDLELSVDRIRAARETIDNSGIPFVLVGRSDSVNIGNADGLSEAIERVNRFREAGADCLFVPGASDTGAITELVKEVDGPINMVMGLTGGDLSVTDLTELGVRRVSIGGSLARAMYYQMRKAAEEMFEQGTFSYAKNQIPQGELNDIFEMEL
jgi:2-methylisocitrate lyase-like PEP mutase family enzyme